MLFCSYTFSVHLDHIRWTVASGLAHLIADAIGIGAIVEALIATQLKGHSVRTFSIGETLLPGHALITEATEAFIAETALEL